MANSYTNRNLPDPLENAVRRVIRGTVGGQDYFGDLYSPNNEAIGHAAAGVVQQQCWGAGSISYTGALAACCEWRIPQIGDWHSTIQPEAYVAAGGASQVDWTSTNSGATVSVAFGAGGPGWQTPGALSIGAGGPEDANPFDTITMELAGTGVDLRTATMRFTPVASPIAAGVKNGISPMGASSSVADGAMTAAHGRRWRTNIEKLRLRPRMLLCWSGVAAAIGGPPETANSLGRRSSVLVRPGAFDLGRSYQVHIKAKPDAVNDTIVVLKAGGAWGDIEGTILTIPGGGATDWYTTTIRLPEGRNAPSLLPFKAARVGFWPAGPGGPPTGRSTALILGASIWGE